LKVPKTQQINDRPLPFLDFGFVQIRSPNYPLSKMKKNERKSFWYADVSENVHEDYDITFCVAPDNFVETWWSPLVEMGYRVKSDFAPYLSVLSENFPQVRLTNALMVSGAVFEPESIKPCAIIEIHSWNVNSNVKIVQLWSFDLNILRTFLASGLRLIAPLSNYAHNLLNHSFRIADVSVDSLSKWFEAHGLLCRMSKKFNEISLSVHRDRHEATATFGIYFDARNNEKGFWVGPIDCRATRPSIWTMSHRKYLWPDTVIEVTSKFDNHFTKNALIAHDL